MPRLVLTEEQLTALVQLLRDQDLSSKPVLRDVLKRLERLARRNDAARYPTPPAEDSQVDPSEKVRPISCVPLSSKVPTTHQR